MDVITEDKVNAVLNKEIETLIELDNSGLLIGPDESIKDYANRLQNLSRNINEFKTELQSKGEIEINQFTFSNSDLISPEIFENSQDITQGLYDFTIDWVPGFFTNHRMGILFAGCAMYSYDDFFAIFIIRKSFKFKRKWIIYDRRELMAHELCHIAHIGFKTKNYEEIFAYQTSESSFRKKLGGILRSTTDTYLLLSTVFILLGAQIVNITTRAPAQWNSFPIPIIYAATVLVFLVIASRYLVYWLRFKRAWRNLCKVFGDTQALPVLFRCSDSEVNELARFRTAADTSEWLCRNMHASIRWQVIMKKYSLIDFC